MAAGTLAGMTPEEREARRAALLAELDGLDNEPDGDEGTAADEAADLAGAAADLAGAAADVADAAAATTSDDTPDVIDAAVADQMRIEADADARVRVIEAEAAAQERLIKAQQNADTAVIEQVGESIPEAAGELIEDAEPEPEAAPVDVAPKPAGSRLARGWFG